MSALENLIEALNRNTEALLAAGGGAAAEGTSGKASGGKAAATGGKGKAKATTEEDVKAAAVALKDKFGTAEAKKVIKQAGKANSLAEIDEANYAAFVKAAQAKLDEADGDGGDDDNGGL